MSSTTLGDVDPPEEQREKWTISRLNFETGIDRRTLKNILSTVKPIARDKQSDFFHLRDFIRAYRDYLQPQGEDAGDLVREQARLTKIKADIAQVQRARIRKEVITTQEIKEVWRNIGYAIRRTILTSGLTEKEKDHCLNEIKSFNVDEMIATGELGTADNDTVLEHQTEPA